MTVATDLQTRTGTITRLFLKIDAYEPILWERKESPIDNGMIAPTSGYTRSGLVCLNPPSGELGMGLDLAELTSNVSMLEFELCDTQESDSTWKFAKLFAPGTWERSTYKHAWVRRSALGLDTILPSDQYIYASNLDGWDTSGIAYIADTAFSYTDTDVTDALVDWDSNPIHRFEGVSLGIYPCVGSTNFCKSIRLSTDDTAESDITSGILVTQHPITFAGRRVALYITTFDHATQTWNGEDDAKLLWVGRLTLDIRYQAKSRTYLLSAENILADLEKNVFSYFPTGKTYYHGITGYFYNFNGTGVGTNESYSGRKFSLHLIWEEDAPANYNYYGSFTIPQALYTDPNDLATAIQTQLNTAGNWDTSPLGTYSFSVELDNERFIIKYNREFDNDFDSVNNYMNLDIYEPLGSDKGTFPCHALQALGFFGDMSGVEKINGQQMFAINYDNDGTTITGYNPIIRATLKPFRWYHPIINSTNDGYIYIAKSSDTERDPWSNQGDYYPPSSSDTLAHITIKKSYYWQAMQYEPIDLTVSYNDLTYSTDYNKLQIYTILPPIRHDGFGYAITYSSFIAQLDDGDQIEWSQVYIPSQTNSAAEYKGPFELLLAPLLSTGERGYNHSKYDCMPIGFGLGFDAGLVDIWSFYTADSVISGDLTNRTYYKISEPISWKELFEREGKLFGQFLCWSNGALTVKAAYQYYSDLSNITLNEDTLIKRDELPNIDYTTESVINQWNITTTSMITGEENKQIMIMDEGSINSLNIVRELEINHPGILSLDRSATIASLVKQMIGGEGNLRNRFPWAKITQSIAPTMLNRLWIGDVVTWASSRHPDIAGSGLYSTSAKAIVVDLRWKFNPLQGVITLLINGTIDQSYILPWAASALVDVEATNGGWDAVNYKLTLKPWQWANGDETLPHDGEALAASDVIQIIERAPTDPTSTTRWSNIAVVSYSADTYELTLANGTTLTGWDSDKQYIVCPSDYDDCTTAQKSTETFQCNIWVGKLGSASDPPHRWG